MEAIVFLILQIFFTTTRSLENWGISLGYSPVLADLFGDVFRPIVRERKYFMDYKLGYLSMDII